MSKLDELTAEFSDNKDPQVFTQFMETLEKSVILMPVVIPKELEPAMKEAAAAGKPLPVPKGTKPNIRVLPLKDGKFAIPVFTSMSQVPKEKLTAMMQLPFKVAVNMAKAPGSNATVIIVNPFSKGVILKEELIDVADRRLKAQEKNAVAGAGNQKQSMQLTEKQVHILMHSKVARDYLPGKFFNDKENAFSDLRVKKEAMIIEAYRDMYPEGLKCPYDEDDVSVMNLQVEEGLVITRIDLPDANKQPGSPLRIYLAQTEDALHYYVIEKGEKGKPGTISEIDADGKYTTVMDAPDNGVEIETIMTLTRPS